MAGHMATARHLSRKGHQLCGGECEGGMSGGVIGEVERLLIVGLAVGFQYETPRKA